MKIERVKSKKKYVIISLVFVVVAVTLILATTRAKFKNTESIPLARGTINYSPADFSMMAIKISDDKTNYTDTNSVPTSGYTLNTEKSTCTVGTTAKTVPMEYKDGKVYFGVNEKNTKCNLYFDKYIPTSKDTMDKLGITNITEQTESVPNFASAATSNEGVFKTSDGMYGGDTYYWRGAVDNNHIIFADLCWKMVRINGDGSIRLIYNGAPSGSGDARTCKQASDATSIAKTSQKYNASYNKSYYVGWTYGTDQRPTDNNSATASNIKTQTESWYKTNITDKGYDAQVATGKFCNDRNTKTGQGWTASGSGSTFYYAGYERLVDNKKPVTTCPTGDVYEMKVGAITADEASMAGGVYGTANSSYYLCNSQYYWTMSPSYWDSGYAGVFLVNSDGQLSWIDVNDTDLGVRPVINLRSDTVFASGGKGTASIPYITT